MGQEALRSRGVHAAADPCMLLKTPLCIPQGSLSAVDFVPSRSVLCCVLSSTSRPGSELAQ